MRRLLKIFGVAAAMVVASVAVYTLYRTEGDRLTVTTAFADVADLAIDAPVHFADIRIGRVSDVELVVDAGSTRAKVTLRIDRSAQVPAEVTPLLRRTSVLGEKFVELAPRPDADLSALLTDDTDLGEGVVVSDLEQLVAEGEEIFSAVAASELAIILEEGATAFDGQGSQLRQLLDDASVILDGYASRTDDISSLITNLESFASTTGPAAQSHADALGNLADTLDTLESQRTELIDLLVALDELAEEGRAILDGHLDEIARAFDAVQQTTDKIVLHQDDLATILQSLPGHNRNLPTGVNNSFVQVLNDVVVCGFPGGGERDTPVYTCSNKYAEPIPSQREEEPG